MLDEFEDFLSAFLVMAELTGGAPVTMKTLHKDESLSYLRLNVNKIFEFELFCYEDRLVFSIYLMKHVHDHKALISYLSKSNFETSHFNHDSSTHSARYTFYDFDEFKKLFVEMAKIAKLKDGFE
jgi:hypothetical protein